MIFYKLSNVTKKIKRLRGRLTVLIRLAAFKTRYIIQVLEIEEKIARLEMRLHKNFISNEVQSEKENSQKGSGLVHEHQSYLRFLEPRLIEALAQVDITVILSETIDDCLSMLTDKGLIQRNIYGWYIDLKNGITATMRFMDIAVESLKRSEIVCH